MNPPTEPIITTWCYQSGDVIRSQTIRTGPEGYSTLAAQQADHNAAVQAAQAIWIPVDCP